jgi:acetyl-CoA C-acetyltransferase
MREVVITSAVRTPNGSFGGALSQMSPVKYGALAIEEAIKRSSIAKDQVNEVIMGMVLPCSHGQNPARLTAVQAGLPWDTGCLTINKVCGSALKAMMLAVQAIQTGDADVVVAGGMENMSMAPFYLDKARFGYRMGTGSIHDHMVHDGLWDVVNDFHMGISNELCSEKYAISREDQDRYAAASQEKAVRAIKEGKFAQEIVPVEIPQKKGEPVVFDTDERPMETSLEKMAKLPPVFKKNGTVTAGNASGISDAAAGVLLMSEQESQNLGLKPMARILGFASGAVDPAYMGVGPIPAVKKALKIAGISLEDVDLIELNEAFASQAIACMRELGLGLDRTNIYGSGISLGHPIGCTGARVTVTLLHAMKRRKARYGLATMCIGGGQGMAMVFERAT